MLLVFSALVDPLLQGGDLFRRERTQLRFERRHVVVVGCNDAFDDLAFIRIAGDDGLAFNRSLALIETKISLPLLGVEAMTVEAFV